MFFLGPYFLLEHFISSSHITNEFVLGFHTTFMFRLNTSFPVPALLKSLSQRFLHHFVMSWLHTSFSVPTLLKSLSQRFSHHFAMSWLNTSFPAAALLKSLSLRFSHHFAMSQKIIPWPYLESCQTAMMELFCENN